MQELEAFGSDVLLISCMELCGRIERERRCFRVHSLVVLLREVLCRLSMRVVEGEVCPCVAASGDEGAGVGMNTILAPARSVVEARLCSDVLCILSRGMRVAISSMWIKDQ